MLSCIFAFAIHASGIRILFQSWDNVDAPTPSSCPPLPFTIASLLGPVASGSGARAFVESVVYVRFHGYRPPS